MHAEVNIKSETLEEKVSDTIVNMLIVRCGMCGTSGSNSNM